MTKTLMEQFDEALAKQNAHASECFEKSLKTGCVMENATRRVPDYSKTGKSLSELYAAVLTAPNNDFCQWLYKDPPWVKLRDSFGRDND